MRVARPATLRYGLDLIDVQIRAGIPDAALATIAELRGEGEVDDPPLDLFEADASEDLGDYARSLAAGLRSRSRASAESAPQIVVRARQLRWCLGGVDLGQPRRVAR